MQSKSLILTLSSAAFGLALLLGAANADASHRHHGGALRLNLDVRTEGPTRVPLKRLLRRQHQLDVDNYRLRAVVIHNQRRSRGFARLSSGRFESDGYRLRGRHRVRIVAPPSDGRWQLHLSPGSRVRSVTAVLEPRGHRGRHRGEGWRDDYLWRDRHGHGYRRWHNTDYPVLAYLFRQWELEERQERREQRREERREQRREERQQERAWHRSYERAPSDLARSTPRRERRQHD